MTRSAEIVETAARELARRDRVLARMVRVHGVPVIGGVVTGSVATVNDSGTVVVVVAAVVEVCATGRARAAP